MSVLKRTYFKLRSEAKKEAKQKEETPPQNEEEVEVEVEVRRPDLRGRRGRTIPYSAVTRTISRNRASGYTRIAIRFVRRLQRFCYGIRNFVGLAREPYVWNEDDIDED